MARTKKRFSVGVDRLSSLPDDLIGKILSYVNVKQAIETSVLSSRWRYTWTLMPSLNFSSKDFRTLHKFSKFVTHVLSRRNNQVELSFVMLIFHGNVSLVIVKRVLNYASSHNIQKLEITCLSRKKIKVFLPVFKSQSLKSLTLTSYIEECFFVTPYNWELPALTTLDLFNVTLCYDNTNMCANLFSNCAKLINLTLDSCMITGFDVFNICHPGLSSLTLARCVKNINVVTPELENLVVNYWYGIHLISAPNLSSFSFTSSCYEMKISTDLFHLEKLDVCIFYPYNFKTSPHQIIRLFQQIHSVKHLTLSMELIQFISSSVELIVHQPSPFVNLKTLKIYPSYITSQPEEVTFSTEVKEYLLDGSPGATFSTASDEEIHLLMKLTFFQHIQKILDRIAY